VRAFSSRPKSFLRYDLASIFGNTQCLVDLAKNAVAGAFQAERLANAAGNLL
jgi:hypothetical protein